MKKIVVVSGSPHRHGNTMSIISKIEDKIKAADENITFKHIHLIDMDLKWCRGCWKVNCLKKGGNSCPLRDDREAIKKELDSADGLVFATPCYGHLPSALFLNFTNRFMYLDHLLEYIGIPTIIIVTAETDGANRAAKYIDTMFALPWGCNVVGRLAISNTFYKTNSRFQIKMLNRIDKISNNFHQMLFKTRTQQPSLMQYLCFLYNREEAMLYEKILTSRYEFWKTRGWLESSYYYDMKIMFSYRAIGWLVILALNRYAKKGIGKNHKEKLANYYK